MKGWISVLLAVKLLRYVDLSPIVVPFFPSINAAIFSAFPMITLSTPLLIAENALSSLGIIPAKITFSLLSFVYNAGSIEGITVSSFSEFIQITQGCRDFLRNRIGVRIQQLAFLIVCDRSNNNVITLR